MSKTSDPAKFSMMVSDIQKDLTKKIKNLKITAKG